MEKQKSGISIQTLIISALAAVAAAVIVPMIWERGTLVATAMTPVIVALVSEALRKPAQVITSTTKRSATGLAVRSPDRFDPLPPEERDGAPAVREDDPFGLRAAPPRRMRHHWWIAGVTGVAAFAIGVVALTGTELVFGGAATKEGGRTTFFSRDRATPTPTATATPTTSPDEQEEATPTPTATATPTPTVTPAPTATASPQTAPAPTASPTATP